jgi:DNA invertase Pin-like site-specific DNA recombinase
MVTKMVANPSFRNAAVYSRPKRRVEPRCSIAALNEAGAAKVFKEKIRGAANHRAQLHRLLKTIDAGDVVIVTRLDRLARSTRDLLNILDKIAKAGATFKSLWRHLGRHDHGPRTTDAYGSWRAC